MERSAWGGDASGVPWWRVALGYARVVLRDQYVRGVVLALAAWAAVRWQRPELTAWADAAWAALATLLGAGLAVERVRSGAAARAIDELVYAAPPMDELSRVRAWAIWARGEARGILACQCPAAKAVDAILDGRKFTDG